MQRLKISREGIILIKSFEGFRPHAVRREDGQWVIGYGHTLSAREGGVVSEPDAELLLQFDLIPVAKALNETAGPLNQHQFDALASFAFSVGLEKFQSSDVLARLSSGATGEAADALVGWTVPQPNETPLRRRAAERALFVADPARPVALAELLAAPLPPPAVAAPAPSIVEAEPVVETGFAETSPAEPRPVQAAPAETVAILAPAFAVAPTVETPADDAAVEEAQADPAPIETSHAEAEVAEAETPVAETVAVEAEEPAPAFVADATPELADRVEREASDLSSGVWPAAIETVAVPAFDAPASETVAAGAAETEDVVGEPTAAEAPVFEAQTLETETGQTLSIETPAVTTSAFETPTLDIPAFTPTAGAALISSDVTEAAFPTDPDALGGAALQRYAGYAGAIIGPLPGTAHAASTEPATEDAGPARLVFEDPQVSEFPAVPTPLPFEGGFRLDVQEPSPFQPSISTHDSAADGGELHVSAPLDEGSIFPAQRIVWPHAETGADQSPLFEDDGALRLGAHQMIRHEIVSEEPRRLDWREIGLYVLMSAFGLVTFGMSVAAFRRAAQPSGGSDFTTVAWVLAVFGFACIAVSAWNLYRKLGRPED